MKHMIGVREEGVLYRFPFEYSDEQFQELAHHGLPEGFVAFHFHGNLQWAVIKKLPIKAMKQLETALTKHQIERDPSNIYGACRRCGIRPAYGLYRGVRYKVSNTGKSRLIPVNQYVCENCANKFMEETGRCGLWLKSR